MKTVKIKIKSPRMNKEPQANFCSTNFSCFVVAKTLILIWLPKIMKMSEQILKKSPEYTKRGRLLNIWIKPRAGLSVMIRIRFGTKHQTLAKSILWTQQITECNSQLIKAETGETCPLIVLILAFHYLRNELDFE